MTTSYEQVLLLAHRAGLLESSAAVLSWDQETMMPPRGLEHRSAQLEELAKLAHEFRTSTEFADRLAAAEAEVEDPDHTTRTNLREWRRCLDRQQRVPTELVGAFASTTSKAQHEWAEARRTSDFGRFAPWLEKLVQLSRERAACLGTPSGGEAWDALAEDYEPGLTAAAVEQLFETLRPELVALRQELAQAPSPPTDAFARVTLDQDRQEAFVREVAERLGYDFSAGRLDRSTHPFTTGFHPHDVRITTRFADDDVLDALGSTMHEVGHGLYEQGLPSADAGTPCGSSISLGIHESQSRLWENHVGRNRSFWEWCWPIAQKHFGAAVQDFDSESAWRCANRVAPGFIRVEADEVTYDLHVMIRFDIERRLIRGDLAVADLPGEWNRQYAEAFGLEVPDDARGCLQDVHWSFGMFGYFPTYTLGNLYSAQLFAAAREALPDLDGAFGRGEFAPLLHWLNEKVHAVGMRQSAAELCRSVTGEDLRPEPFLTSLRQRIGAAHGL